jgi:hypothetical protein
MPILPIDLQILFSQMNQVGKEQSVLKEGAQIQSSMQQMGIVKQTEQKDNSVNESHDVGDGVGNLKNEARNRQEQTQEKKERREKEAKKNKKFFQDPALGHNIDIES